MTSGRSLRDTRWAALSLVLLGALGAAGHSPASWGGPRPSLDIGPPLVNLFDSRILMQNDRSDAVNEPGDRFGEGLVAGDFGADGVIDLVVGAPGEALGGDPESGVAYPFRGSGGGPTQALWFYLPETMSGGTNELDDEFGAALAAGDFNGDGFMDLCVGAPGKAPQGTVRSGAVFTFFGSPGGLNGGSPFTQAEAGEIGANGDEFGRALAAGDFNGDGYDDLAVGAPGKTLGGAAAAGAVFIFPGGPFALETGVVISQASIGQTHAADDRFGAALAAADFTADEKADLAAGVPGKDIGSAAGAGAVAVLAGSDAGLVAGWWLTQEDVLQASEAGDQFGLALAGGDIDGDGEPDLVVGIPGKDIGPAADTGLACAVLGGGEEIPGGCVSQASAGVGPESGARFGSGLGAGDLDADGRADLVVGAPLSGLSGVAGSGALFLFAGTATVLEARSILVQEDVGHQSQPGDELGSRVAVADFDDDGMADVAASAPDDEPTPGGRSGSVFVFPGLARLPAMTHGPIVGAVTDSRIKIWARADRPAGLAFEYRVAGTAWPGQTSATMPIGEAADLAGAVAIADLQPATSYEYRALLDGVVQPQSEGSFRTLAPVGSASSFTFAVGADTAFGRDPYPILDAIRARAPGFMLLLGDQMYADDPPVNAGTTQEFGRKYRQNWNEPHYRALMRDIPVFMMWDDHEIQDNWDFGPVGRYIPARAAFDIYQGSHNPDPRVAGNLYHAFRSGNTGFYVMDTRTFRSFSNAPDNAGKTMLGAAQKTDLKQWLSSSTDRIKFLVSAVMWNDYGTTAGDSWAGYRTERQEIFDYIRSNHICGVVLLSGDQHWTGVFRLRQASPYVFHELSPTPLGTGSRQKTAAVSPDILFKYDASRAYGLVTVDSTATPERMTWEVYDHLDQSIYSLDLTWPDLCPDSDGDTFRDDVDCLPDDPATWSRPGEVTLLWSDHTTLTWGPPASAGGLAAPRFDLLVSTTPDQFSSGTTVCLASDGQDLSAADPALPEVDQARYYLVRTENTCGGTLGGDSSGQERSGRPCP